MSQTIEIVLEQFLDEQRRRLSARTYAQYRSVVELLQHCLNGYGHQSLSEFDSKRFDRLYQATGDAHREFCQIFGPEHILPNISEFLRYFMIRKVMAGQGLLRAAGTVTKKLAVWLAKQGYAEAGQVNLAVEHGTEAARDLPKASDLAARLAAFAEAQDIGEATAEIDDYFRITRVQPGQIWLRGLDDCEYGPIRLPAELSRRCQIGWTISGIVGRVEQRWRLIEAWTVYPP
jgi:hypothetical protein